MFGVNKEGQDVLAPQFKKGPGSRRGSSEPMPNRDPEHEMAVLSNKMSITKNKELMAKIRERGYELLSRNQTHHPQEVEIQKFIEKEVQRLAEERTQKAREEIAEMASRAAILRNR